ncbi:hypothetical protein [Halosolutus halophilus]|uniref:hypothetical protein n=1 Tax=Halosolutus halophilus TaxID=1552990 RepID=UPI0022351A98|nr:hypothetical protein [Halosolutus halophilus]
MDRVRLFESVPKGAVVIVVATEDFELWRVAAGELTIDEALAEHRGEGAALDSSNTDDTSN